MSIDHDKQNLISIDHDKQKSQTKPWINLLKDSDVKRILTCMFLPLRDGLSCVNRVFSWSGIWHHSRAEDTAPGTSGREASCGCSGCKLSWTFYHIRQYHTVKKIRNNRLKLSIGWEIIDQKLSICTFNFVFASTADRLLLDSTSLATL